MLKQLLPLIVVGVAIWLCCTQYALWGGLLLVAMGVFMYFKRYTGFCISMAMRYYGISDIKTAFRWFEKAEKRGMNPKQKITYAYYLMREGRVEKSENILNAVLAFKLAPELKYPAKSNHAILMMKTGRMAEAQEELEEIFPTYRNTNVYGTLGYLYIMGNDMEKAKAFNLEAYDFNSENAVILDNMVQLYTKLGDYDEAYRYACELMEQKPIFIEAYYNVAVVEKELGKIDDAKAHLEHALTIRPTFLTTVSHEEVQKLLDSLAA